MRIYLKTTKNKSTIPFEYQHKMVGALHKWLGDNNDDHGEISLYSFSWLRNTIKTDGGFDCPNGATFFVSFYDKMKIKTIIKSIMNDATLFCGMQVCDITIEETPDLKDRDLFYVASPVFVKRQHESKIVHYKYDDPETNVIMKEIINKKLQKAGLPVDEILDIRFDLSYNNKKQKVVTYKGISNKANFCPLIIQGQPETKQFVWNVGVGNCTGIGFGSIY